MEEEGWRRRGDVGVLQRIKMEGEPQRKRRRGFGCNILLCNPSSVVGVLHLLKLEEENSFAISAPCPEGPGLPQSHGSVALPSAPVAKQKM